MPVLRDVGVWQFIKRVYGQTTEDATFTWASALAYSWLFAIFPFFIFLMTLVPFVLPQSLRATADHEAAMFLYQTLPKEDADTVWINLQDFLDQPRGGLLSIGLLITLFAASGGINATMHALDRCYDLPTSRPFWKQRLLAIALTIGVAIMIILVILLIPVGGIVTRWLGNHADFGPLIWAFNLLRYALAIVLMLGAVGLIYNYGPNIKQHRNWLSPGAIFTVSVWLLLGLTFQFYVTTFGTTNPTYAAVGGVAVLLLFFYVDAAVLLIGAEINSEIDFAVTGAPKGTTDFRTKVNAAALDTKI